MKYIKYIILLLILLGVIIWSIPALFAEHEPLGTLAPNQEEGYIPEILYETEKTVAYDVAEYEINSYSSDITLQQVLEVLQQVFDSEYFNPYDGSEHDDTDVIEYISDYNSVLGNAGLRSGDIYKYLVETIIISPSNDELVIYCDRFDSKEMACSYYKDSFVDLWIIRRDYRREKLNIVNNSSEGYCICYSETSYLALYLLDDIVFYYATGLDKTTTTEFEQYLEICNQLNLPTDESINEEVLEQIKYNR
ncbi:MAG: hypothetical protein MJ172_08635 [Clostridia bacterium]|nr:hypothetical protein [Clostridia bacterium]